MSTIKRFIRDEKGATAIEYGLIAAGISVAIITVVATVGTSLNTTFTSVADRSASKRLSASTRASASLSVCARRSPLRRALPLRALLTEPQGAAALDVRPQSEAAPRRVIEFEPIMLADAARLMLFPALMAFAASSDLLTMTISNRVSLILVGGFFVLALVIGMSPAVILTHIGAAGPGAGRGLRLLCAGLDRRRRRQARGRDRALARFRPSAGLSGLCLAVRRPADAACCCRFAPCRCRRCWRARQWAERLHRKDSGVPYGIALAAAALAVYPDTIWMKADRRLIGRRATRTIVPIRAILPTRRDRACVRACASPIARCARSTNH